MSTNAPDADADGSDQDRTPYLPRDDGRGDTADGIAVDDDLEPALSPAEDVQLRRDLELELERFEQGMEG